MRKKKRREKRKYTIKRVTELPLTLEEKKRRRRILLKEYLEGKFRRFLRKHSKRYWYELVYSRTIPKWRKDKVSREAVDNLLKKGLYPTQVRDIINIMYTLEEHFDWVVNKKNMEIAYHIWDYFDIDKIEPYMLRKYRDNLASRNRPMSYYLCTPRQALREQKARGFIHINEFEDYDREFAHIFSTVDSNYVIPENFSYHSKQFHPDRMYIYIAHGVLGVRGYTKLVTPPLE